jgi:hypothetical protein
VRQKLGLAAVGLVAIAVAHPLCNLFFRCGCGWLGPAHCNIHLAAGPHCPWCVGTWRFVAVGSTWALGAWLGCRLALRRWTGAAPAFFGGLAGVLIFAVISGAVTVALTGYPHFIFW